MKNLIKLNKKGLTIGDISPIVIALVTIIVVGGVGLLIVTAVQSQGPGTAAFNTSVGYGATAITTLLQWLPLIALVIASVIIISLIRGQQ